MNKTTVGVIIAIVAIFGGMVIYSAVQNSQKTVDYETYNAAGVISDEANSGGIAEHVRGKADSRVVVVEYADFQCPGCASMMPKMNTLYEEYKDQVAFVFRHYPISGHQNARSAAAASEAAGLQGYFWEMAEALYDNRTDWIYESGSERTQKYISIFEQAAPDGDVAAFQDAITNNKDLEKKINFDLNIGKNLSKVQATPSFYVNGEYVTIGDQDSLDDLMNNIKAKIDEHLAK